MEAHNAVRFSRVHMTDAELDVLYKTTNAGRDGLLPTTEAVLDEARGVVEDAYYGDGAMSLTDDEICRLFKAAKRADVNWLPSNEADLESALDKLENAYEN